jgi:hypothetical protein
MSDTQSVLDTMTAGIIGRKAERAAGLTPVGMERPGAPVVTQPIGITLEQVERHLLDLDDANRASRRYYESLIRTAQRFVALLQDKPDTTLDEGAGISAISVVVQTATVGDAPPLNEGWGCPTHDQQGFKELTSRRGRKYRACTICEEFEK